MKRNYLLFLIIIFIFGICVFMLTACVESQPPHVHVYDKTVATADFIKSEATCEKQAEYYYSCSCGEKGTETFYDGERLGHDFNIYLSVFKSATCEENLVNTYKCTRCIENNNIEIANTSLGHKYTEYIDNENAKCGQNGTETAKCDRENCLAEDVREKENSACHIYSNKGKCKCGDQAEMYIFDAMVPTLFSANATNCWEMLNCPLSFDATFYFYHEYEENQFIEADVDVIVYDELGNVVVKKQKNVKQFDIKLETGKNYYCIFVSSVDFYVSGYKWNL